MWKEFDLSRNPRNGGDVLAKDVDGHHGDELRKKISLSPKKKKILARLDTKIQTSSTGSFSCHMSQAFKIVIVNKIFCIVQLFVVIIFRRKKLCEKYYVT